MSRDKIGEILSPHDVWIISQSRFTDLDISRINDGKKTGPVVEYRISDLTKYLLNPNPIEVKKRLIGCEIHFTQPSSNSIRTKLRTFFFGKNGNNVQNETLIVDNNPKTVPLKDENLVSHINKIYRFLKPYDPVLKRLLTLDRKKITDIIGICEDIDGNRTWLSLKGGVDEKINYISNFITEDVGVILDKAFVADGYFEMRGFDFTSYDPTNSYKFLKFSENGTSKSCVLGADGNIQYWVTDNKLVHFMQLLEQSLQRNPKFYDSFQLCKDGKAKPLRLLFNRTIAIDYSKANLPEAYRDVFDTFNVGLSQRDMVLSILKNRQLGIMFQYIPESNTGDEKLLTNISVFHDLSALDPIKDDLPQLYSEIDKKASVLEAGKFYLLDSIRGCTSEY